MNIKSFLQRLSAYKFTPFILNAIVVIFLFALPYYLFQGRLFLGGDDTRLQYVYPLNVIANLSFFSWVNIASLPSYLPNYHSIPFLLFFSLLNVLIPSKVFVFYFAFSLPFVLGYVYFQKFINELIGENFTISFLSSIIYICSPITVVSQMLNFLFSMYLMGLVPILAYYFVSYIKKGKKSDIYKVVGLSLFLSMVFYAIQWIIAAVFPFACSLILFIFVSKPDRKMIKRSLMFIYFVSVSQLFWVIPFIISFFNKTGVSLGERVASAGFVDSFVSTVLSTATGNIIYPLVTFYQRRIAYDYEWQLINVFRGYFDYTLIISGVFISIVLLGFIYYNKVLSNKKKQIFIFFAIAFLFVLYFSTVNIGFLKNIFLLMRYIPGFSIFRNFTDKFALSYIFIYSTFLSLCLLVIKKKYRYYPLFYTTILIVVCINFFPVKQIVAGPLWKTKSIYTTVTIPQEYLDFTRQVRNVIPNDTNVIVFPQNITAYAIITENNQHHAYVGTSPFKFFTGINDLPGDDSYPSYIDQKIHIFIENKDYEDLLKLLSQINTGYVMVIQNIPDQVKNSYLYDKTYLSLQDQALINALVDHEVVKSSKGNYIIYKLKNSTNVIASDGSIMYKKINPVLYKIILRNVKNNQKLSFFETFHLGWNLYPSNDFIFLTQTPLFAKSHSAIYPYGNEWTIDKNKLSSTSNVTLYLYFQPQSYFYVSILISFVMLILGILMLNSNYYEKKSNKS